MYMYIYIYIYREREIHILCISIMLMIDVALASPVVLALRVGVAAPLLFARRFRIWLIMLSNWVSEFIALAIKSGIVVYFELIVCAIQHGFKCYDSIKFGSEHGTRPSSPHAPAHGRAWHFVCARRAAGTVFVMSCLDVVYWSRLAVSLFVFHYCIVLVEFHASLFICALGLYICVLFCAVLCVSPATSTPRRRRSGCGRSRPTSSSAPVRKVVYLCMCI